MFQKIKKFCKENLDFIIACVTCYCIVHTLFAGYSVSGHSMDPTLHNGEIGISSKLIYTPEYEDIVIVKGKSGDSNELWVKRVIGMPGDTLYCKNNTVYRNGKPLKETYLGAGTVTEDFSETTLGNDEYFVMGDNRQHSADSRIFGTFHKNEIVAEWLFGLF